MERGDDNSIDEEHARSLAIRYKVDYVNLPSVCIPQSAIDTVPRSVAIEYCIIPLLRRAGSLVVITSDPGDIAKREKLGFILERAIEFAVAPEPYLKAAIDIFYPETENPE